MSKRNFRKGPQEGQAPRPQGAPPAGRPPQQGGQHGQRPGQAQQGKGPGWVQTRDSVRRDLEVALQSLSFLERFGEGLDSQRRLFIDFPRVTEELRSGAMERLAVAMEHLYEGGQGALDLNRFLRDLPLALGHLAAAEFAAHRQKQQQAAARLARESGAVVAAPDASKSEAHASEETGKSESSGAGEPAHAEAAPEPHAGAAEESGEAAHAETAPASDAHADEAAAHEAAAGAAHDASAPASASESAEAAASPGESTSSAAPGESAASAAAAGKPEAAAPAPDAASAATPEPVSPRVELRTRLLAAAPQLSKAAQSYRRNTATVRRAASPRRALGPWRSDREVLDQARRAVEFANKILRRVRRGVERRAARQGPGPGDGRGDGSLPRLDPAVALRRGGADPEHARPAAARGCAGSPHRQGALGSTARAREHARGPPRRGRAARGGAARERAFRRGLSAASFRPGAG